MNFGNRSNQNPFGMFSAGGSNARPQQTGDNRPAQSPKLPPDQAPRYMMEQAPPASSAQSMLAQQYHQQFHMQQQLPPTRAQSAGSQPPRAPAASKPPAGTAQPGFSQQPPMMYESQVLAAPPLRPAVSGAHTQQQPRRSPSFPKQGSPSAPAPASVYPQSLMMVEGAWPSSGMGAPSSQPPPSAASQPPPAAKEAAPPKLDFWGMGSYQQPAPLDAPPMAQTAAPALKSDGQPPDVISVEDASSTNASRDAWRNNWPPPQTPALMKQSPPHLYQPTSQSPWPVAKPPASRDTSPKLSASFPPASVPLKADPAQAQPPQMVRNLTSPSMSPGLPADDVGSVVRLLKRHGYPSMAALIEEDVEKGCVGRSDQTASRASEERRVNGQFLSAARRLPTKENPLANYRNFVRLYSSFWQWSMRAVDFVRQPLREISFIIFIELWCRLLSLSLKKAAAFLKKFGEAHYIHHPHEISEMRRVESFAVLRDVPFVSRILRGERFHLKADNLTKKLLTTRLTMDNDTVILDILQKRLIWEPPTDTAEDPGLAVLASNHLKSSVTKDVGSAIITPSLPLLCGLPPPPPRDLGLKSGKYGVPLATEEPGSKVLPANLSALYRLPRVEEQEKPAVDWRMKKFEQDRIGFVLSRPKPDAMPSVLALDIGAVQIEQKFASPAKSQRHRLALGCVAVSKCDNASTVAVSDDSSNSIWLWDLNEAAWKASSNIYKKQVFNPWLLSYAKMRSTSEVQEKNELEPAAVSFDFDDETYTIPENILDETYGALSTSDNADNSELFAEMLGNSGLTASSYMPACLSGHQDPVTAINFLSPFLTGGRSKLALSGSYDGKMILWETSRRFPVFTYKSGSPILDVDSDRYGYLFLTGHSNKAACLWCMDRRNPLRVLNRHSSSVEKVSFHPNSILLATAAADDRVRLWDQRIPDIVGLICGIRSPRCLEFAPNGRYLAISGTESSKVQIWDLIAGKLSSSIVIDPTKNQEFATSLAFRHGSNMLAITTTKGTVQLWDLTQHSSQINKRAGVTEPTAIDLAAHEENKEFLESLKNKHFQGCVAEYSFSTSRAKKVSQILHKRTNPTQVVFTEKNCLLCVNEAQPA